MNISDQWVAGFLDGEGSVAIKRAKRGSHINYQLWVAIGMSDKPENSMALYKIKEKYGGNICSYANKGNRNNVVMWTIVSNQAKTFLKRIRRHLLIKRRQAELCIKFQTGVIRGAKYTPSQRQMKDNIFYELRVMNAKGKLHLQRLNEPTP